jgi:hypothetical protein
MGVTVNGMGFSVKRLGGVQFISLKNNGFTLLRPDTYGGLLEWRVFSAAWESFTLSLMGFAVNLHVPQRKANFVTFH